MNIKINNSGINDNFSLPIDGLSADTQTIINEYTSVYQCSRDMIVSVMFNIVGSSVGKRLVIDDGKYNNFLCLWTVNVAPSGSNKSAPVKSLLQPMREADAESYKAYREALKEWKKSGDEKSEKPTFRQHLLSNSTPEARNQVLANNPNGIFLYRDEIRGFLDDIGRYNRSGEVSDLLSLFDADDITVNRKSEDTLLIEKPFMSIFGSIQPDILASTFGKDLLMGNGFNQRWLFCYPDACPPAMYSEKTLSKDVAEAWGTYIRNLMSCDFSEHGNTLYLSDEAKAIYVSYFNKMSEKQTDADGYISSVYSKLRIQVLRWCGIAHLLGNNPGMSRILPEEMEYSIRCMDYFERCAKKVYMKLMEIKKQPEAKPMGNEEMIARVYYANNPKSQRAFADALGVSQPYIAKCLKKYSRLSSYQLSGCESVDNE